MAKRMNEAEVTAMLKKKIDEGQVLFMPNCGCGLTAKLQEAEAVGVPASKGWPLECYASGVAPDQAGELRDYLAKKGVPTEVSADGNPIYRDAAHRRKALKARGLHDKASFF